MTTNRRLCRALSRSTAMILTAVSVTACATTAGTESAPGTTPSGVIVPSAATTTFSSLRSTQVPVGGKATLVFFFAVDCGPCLQAATDLAAAQRQINTPVAYHAVNMAGDQPDAIREFFAAANHPSINVITGAESLITRWQVTALGTTLVFDANGRQVYRGVDPDPAAFTAALGKATSVRP
jgi:hypothetical protein